VPRRALTRYLRLHRRRGTPRSHPLHPCPVRLIHHPIRRNRIGERGHEWGKVLGPPKDEGLQIVERWSKRGVGNQRLPNDNDSLKLITSGRFPNLLAARLNAYRTGKRASCPPSGRLVTLTFFCRLLCWSTALLTLCNLLLTSPKKGLSPRL
jgi:hypothetical protein